MALRIDFGHAQRQLAPGALERVPEIDDDTGVPILAARIEFRPARAPPAFAGAPALAAASAPHLAEQALEERAVVSGRFLIGSGAGIFEAGIPVGWRTEVLAGLPVRAELIVGGALVGLAQDLVGLADFLELAFGAGILVHVGMEFARQLAVRALDLVLGRGPLDPEYLVVVLVFHARLDICRRPRDRPSPSIGEGRTLSSPRARGPSVLQARVWSRMTAHMEARSSSRPLPFSDDVASTWG